MRIAIISDIHANVLALQAVLADVRRIGVDRIFNLGDILYGPLWPRETYELLHSLDALTIQGNEDRDVYDATPEELERRSVLKFTVGQLPTEATDWLQFLPKVSEFDDVFLCHGTPHSDLVYLLEDVSRGDAQVRNDAEIVALLGGERSPVVVCGHSHTPRAVRLANGQLIVNPGSVGLPAYSDEHPVRHSMQTYSPDASYALLERHEGRWSVGLRRVPYDSAAAAAKARQLKTPAGDTWAEWLETGRAHV